MRNRTIDVSAADADYDRDFAAKRRRDPNKNGEMSKIEGAISGVKGAVVNFLTQSINMFSGNAPA